MSVKVRRGLGLLVVAVIAFLVLLALLQVSIADGAMEWVMVVALLAAAAGTVGGLFGGLALLAWGLLRD